MKTRPYKTELHEYDGHVRFRHVKRFAWLPKDLTDGVRVWLESYIEVQAHSSSANPDWFRVRSYSLPEAE